MNPELAVAQLKALLKVPGALRIITNEVRPELRRDPGDANSPLDPAKLDAVPGEPEDAKDAAREALRVGTYLRRPSTFVIHDVVRLEGPNDKGQYTAWTAEGDACMGQPEALLARLQEANREAA